MPSYPGVYIEEIPGGVPTISGVATSVTAFIGSALSGPFDEPVAIGRFADFEQIFGGLWIESSLGFAVRDFFLNGGNQGIIVRVHPADAAKTVETDFIGADKESANQGLFALKKVDLFNLLCIPPYNPQDNVDSIVVAAAVKLCEDRRAFFLVDPPSQWTSKDLAMSGIATLGITSKNAALFFPRLRAPNPLRNDQMDDFCPSGAVAGIYARTDAQQGVWKAAAGRGAALTGIPDLSVSLTDGDAAELSKLAINCIRRLSSESTFIWGSRTLEHDDRLVSEWKYVPIRRLGLFIEESVFRGTKWVVFEPNDEPLWARIRVNIGNFLQELFHQGAIQGRTPNEAYFVKCDRTTMTQDEIDGGVVNMEIGFAPLRPAEFVVIKIQQLSIGQPT